MTSIVSVTVDGASIVVVCHICTGVLSLSQAFEEIGHGFVLLNITGRQRLRSLRPHFQVGNGYFTNLFASFPTGFVN